VLGLGLELRLGLRLGLRVSGKTIKYVFGQIPFFGQVSIRYGLTNMVG